jgi:catechol 2,3-dioxygenase-like lactoylglutathione lyase family enzyme
VARFGITGLDHVAIAVADVARSCAFYERVLGLERLHPEWDAPVVMGVGGTGLAIFAAADEAPGSDPPPRFLHVAFRVDRAGFAAAEEALAGEGLEARLRDHGISRSLYFRDPDGHNLELTTYEV